MRGACLALYLVLYGTFLATPAVSGEAILRAWYAEPTTRYAHGVLGDKVEWGALILEVDTCTQCAGMRREQRRIRLPETQVFEDLAPRLIDLDADGIPEVVTIQSHQRQGARIVVYDHSGQIAQNAYIGQAHRWLAPVGAADFDGDGQVEIAYVDRPHLARRLTLLRYQRGDMPVIATLDGVTNHRIGEDFISGGVRDCGAGPEMIAADAGWSRILSVTFDGRKLTARNLARFAGPDSFDPVLACSR